MAAEAKRKRPAVLLVDWIDSNSRHGWIDTDESHKLAIAPCQTAGFLVREDDTQLVLALNRSSCPDTRPWAEMVAIPKVAITKRITLLKAER